MTGLEPWILSVKGTYAIIMLCFFLLPSLLPPVPPTTAVRGLSKKYIHIFDIYPSPPGAGWTTVFLHLISGKLKKKYLLLTNTATTSTSATDYHS
jgi:hypothetical protein